jgi:hypothetical protein
LAVLFTLGGCSSKVVRVAGQSPCKKSFAVISAAREAVDIEYMGSLEAAFLSAGCTAYFSKYAIREVELKGKVDTGVGTQYEDKDNYLDKEGNKRGGSLDKIYGSGMTIKEKVKRVPKPDADYYVYFELDKYADVRIVEGRSNRVVALKKTYFNQDNVKKNIFAALDELGIAHLSPAYDELTVRPLGIDKDADFLIVSSSSEDPGQHEYAAAVEGVLLAKGYSVVFFERENREVERTRKRAGGTGGGSFSKYPGSSFQEKEKYSGMFPGASDYIVWAQQVKEKGERCSILFYDRKTMALVGAVRTRASARNVRKQLGRALEIMAEPSATPRIEKTSGQAI